MCRTDTSVRRNSQFRSSPQYIPAGSSGLSQILKVLWQSEHAASDLNAIAYAHSFSDYEEEAK